MRVISAFQQKNEIYIVITRCSPENIELIPTAKMDDASIGAGIFIFKI